MVSQRSVNEQLKRIKFSPHGWGKGEVSELAHILLPDEEIYECVNGMYEGGFALLVATDIRVLLVDKKPLNYLTVEDLRFDMINEMDYSHRLLGARINIATGSKNLNFRSYNQPRLRKLIGHVQHCMAESKKQQTNHQEGQNSHLEQINQQLQAYLVAQHQHQMQLQQLQMAQQQGKAIGPIPDPVKPSPELSDYLFAQSLLAQHEAETGETLATQPAPIAPVVAQAQPEPVQQTPQLQPVPTRRANRPQDGQLSEIYAEGMQEIFGNRAATMQPAPVAPQPAVQHILNTLHTPIEVNPMRIAYSKLPMALRNRKFGWPVPSERKHVDALTAHTEPAPAR